MCTSSGRFGSEEAYSTGDKVHFWDDSEDAYCSKADRASQTVSLVPLHSRAELSFFFLCPF